MLVNQSKKLKLKLTMRAVVQDVKDFGNETSLHGLAQIVNDNSPIIKRLLWLVIFLASLVYASNVLISSIQGMYA